MEDETRRRVDDANARSLAHVRNAIEIVERVLQENRRLAERPDHLASTEQRVIDGEEELGVLHSELAALEMGDVSGASRIAERFRTIRRDRR
jgi:hypothetical protein